MNNHFSETNNLNVIFGATDNKKIVALSVNPVTDEVMNRITTAISSRVKVDVSLSKYNVSRTISNIGISR